MTHPIERTAATLIRGLRYDHVPQFSDAQVKLCEGAYFSWDAERGDVTLRVRPELGMLFSVQARIGRKPRWFTFNLSLEAGELAPGSILGLVVELKGCEGLSIPLFIRALQDGALADTPFVTPLQGSGGAEIRTLLHRVTSDQALASHSDYLTLVMQLPLQDFTLELRNLSLFVLPPDATRTLAATDPEAEVTD